LLFSRRWWKATIGIQAGLFRGHAELSELLEHTEAPSKSNSHPGPVEKIHDAAARFCWTQISHFGVSASIASTIPSDSWPYRKVQRPPANLFAMLGARIAKGETTDRRVRLPDPWTSSRSQHEQLSWNVT
jgi:hypothetical protein